MRSQSRSGFTIVELLIVVIVIAILAAITLVAYNGIIRQAADSSVISDSQQAQTASKLYAVDHGETYTSWYSGSTPPAGLSVQASGGNIIDLRASADGKSYCIRAYNPKSQYSSIQNAYEIGSAPGACDTLGPSAIAATGNVWKAVRLSWGTACGLGSNDHVYCWGYGTSLLGANPSSYTANSMKNPPIEIDTTAFGGKTIKGLWGDGGVRQCVTTSDDKLYCWGNNTAGALGNNSTTASSVPVSVDTSGVLAGKPIAVAGTGGQYFSCALDTAGKLYCWGENDNMQLSNGSLTNSSVPVLGTAWGLLTNIPVSQLSTGNDHICVIANNTTYCWGDNGSGHAGLPASNYATSPVNISALSAFSGQTIQSIFAQGDTTCAITNASTNNLYCWGYNANGQLGNGTTTATHVPTVVGGALAGKRVVDTSASYNTRCAVTTEGKAYCWGSNSLGVVGNSTIASMANVSSPVAVDVPSQYADVKLVKISVGSYNACGLSDEGKLYCWGFETYGVMGPRASGASFQQFNP